MKNSNTIESIAKLLKQTQTFSNSFQTFFQQTQRKFLKVFNTSNQKLEVTKKQHLNKGKAKTLTAAQTQSQTKAEQTLEHKLYSKAHPTRA